MIFMSCLMGINPGKSHGQGPWVSWRKHRLDDKLIGKKEDTFLFDILMMMVRLQGMPRLERSRLGLQVILDSLCVAPPGLYIVGRVSGNQSTIIGSLTLACTASSCTLLGSRGLLRRCQLSGPR